MPTTTSAARAPALVLILWLCACGTATSNTPVAGLWESESGQGSLEFRPDGKAYMTTFGGTVACTYEVDGERVLIQGPNGTQVLTRSGDRLDAGLGLRFVKR